MLKIFSYVSAGSVGQVCKIWLKVQTSVTRLRCTEAFQRNSSIPKDLAAEIESELFSYCNNLCSKMYQKRARSLVFNLKENSDLLMRLVSKTNELTPRDLVRMSSKQLASTALILQQSGKETNYLIHNKETILTFLIIQSGIYLIITFLEEWKINSLERAKAARPNNPHRSTGMFVCPSCRSSRCCYYQWRRKPIIDRWARHLKKVGSGSVGVIILGTDLSK